MPAKIGPLTITEMSRVGLTVGRGKIRHPSGELYFHAIGPYHERHLASHAEDGRSYEALRTAFNESGRDWPPDPDNPLWVDGHPPDDHTPVYWFGVLTPVGSRARILELVYRFVTCSGVDLLSRSLRATGEYSERVWDRINENAGQWFLLKTGLRPVSTMSVISAPGVKSES